ncbi:MAG TPA: hypothetical protein DHV62_03730 [Elusimicrobia bacterium]|jgi:predicted CXXCH cytochrome family protein|nr:hypothetical protein [Elusimicrobiota bacterium]
MIKKEGFLRKKKEDIKELFLGLVFILFAVVGSKVGATSYEYIGSTNCAVCHPAKYNSWLETKHSTTNHKSASCVGCHTTGYIVKSTATATYTEGYVGCEACHGPGSEHQKVCGECHFGREGKINKHGGDPKIVNYGELSAERSLDVCSACHVRGKSLKADGTPGSFNYPWKEVVGFGYSSGAFTPGNVLTDYLYIFQPGDKYIISGTTVTFADYYWDLGSGNYADWGHGVNGLKWSKHWDNKITCVGCHDAHGSEYSGDTTLDSEDNELCYSCHPDKKKGVHSRHKFTVTTSTSYKSGTTCTGCHMPKTTQHSVVNHTFEIIDPVKKNLTKTKRERVGATYVTVKVNLNDSCTSCHNGVTAPLKSTSTASNDLATLFTLTARAFPADPLNVVVYPNPFKIREARDGVLVFAKIPDGSKVKIYTLSGKFVREVTAGTENCAYWDGKNEDKEECARGIYLFLIESSDGKKQTGKFTLIK